MLKFNLNDFVKVKLTDHGIDLYYHQYDDLISRGAKLTRSYPKIDDSGYTEFQLWRFMQIYGKHMANGAPSVVESVSIFFDDDSFEKVDL